MPPQLCCGATCQIWAWLKGSNLYFCNTEIVHNGEIDKLSFSNPHRTEPESIPCCTSRILSRFWPFNTLRPKQMANILQKTFSKRIFLTENSCILIYISLKFVTSGPMDDNLAMVLVIDSLRTGNKPLPEPMLTKFHNTIWCHKASMSYFTTNSNPVKS